MSYCSDRKTKSTVDEIKTERVENQSTIKRILVVGKAFKKVTKGQIKSEWNHQYPKIATEKFEVFLPWNLKSGQINKIKALSYNIIH